MTIEEQQQQVQQYTKEFVDKFRNTVLEEYAEHIYRWYRTTIIPFIDNVYLRIEKESIETKIRHCHDLIIILGDLRRGVIPWRNKVIDDLPVSTNVQCDIQDALESYIREIGHSVGISSTKEPKVVEAIRMEWGDALAWLPLVDDFEKDANGLYTQESFDYASERIEKCFAESKRLFLLTNEMLTKGLLKYIKSLGVTLCNKTYAQVYRCLEHFGWIPADVLKCHNTTTSKYVKENYIKSKFTNLKDKDFDFEEFLSTPDMFMKEAIDDTLK